ncbi:hypothetical protein [Methylotenera versatilis]|uniref:hypothetical protein n=1 Tax=Methylotenera versatilis TaxID=1055487 RepID=UPI0006492423|nr:hypothetical protein [Methylotenera versatilis]
MVTHLFMQTKNLKQIFLWPIVLGLLSIIGLVVALLEDGLLEDISLIGLAVPIIVIAYFYYIKKYQ